MRPHTFRGGGFLYYSRSIEDDTVVNVFGLILQNGGIQVATQRPQNYEDHMCLVQSPKVNGQLIMYHPKLKGDNRMHSVKNLNAASLSQFRMRRVPTELKNSESMKSIGLKADPFSLNSLFSKEVADIEMLNMEEVAASMYSGATSNRSSQINIEQHYVNILHSYLYRHQTERTERLYWMLISQ